MAPSWPDGITEQRTGDPWRDEDALVAIEPKLVSRGLLQCAGSLIRFFHVMQDLHARLVALRPIRLKWTFRTVRFRAHAKRFSAQTFLADCRSRDVQAECRRGKPHSPRLASCLLNRTDRQLIYQ